MKRALGIWNISALSPRHDGRGARIQSFKEYPPSQRVGSMNLDVVMEQLRSGGR